jgi:hypothetical protein
MNSIKPLRFLMALGIICSFSGCLFTSKTRLNESETQNRILSQQNSAQLTEINNIKSHSLDLEKKLFRSEEQAALMKEQVDLDRRQLANYEREHAELYEQFKNLSRNCAQTGTPDAQTIR